MATQKKTPGVYVEESSSFPPSVTGVATAVPAFIGYTAKGPLNTPTSISSLFEYQSIFGTGNKFSYVGGELKGQEYVLYDSIRLYFDNGGGDCYVVSIGNYTSAPSSAAYTNILPELEKIDDITLLLFPDAATLLDANGLKTVQTQALSHCVKMGGRFTILDLSPVKIEKTQEPDPNDQEKTITVTKSYTDLKSVVEQFRLNIGANNLCYGAAYYPYFYSAYKKDIPADVVLLALGAKPLEKNDDGSGQNEGETKVRATRPEGISDLDWAYELSLSEDPEDALDLMALLPKIPKYAETQEEFAEKASIIPPSGAIAGIYAATDNRVGVWQAPANVSVSSINGLTELISDAQQEDLNWPDNGKSINAIRCFKGKGFLVWGCRTLYGNDREWKYVNVRRFFNYVEQSLKKATDWAVFQPNDINTWIKIQCQIEGFLTTLWRDGALAGATPDKAFFVEVGLGKTMDSNDILDGNLRVRIGLAAVRPAEFIILEFSHKVQE